MTDIPQTDPEEVKEAPEETSVEETKDTTENTEVVETTETETTEESKKETESEETEFDVEEFKKQTVSETQKAVLEKMMASLGMTKEEKAEAKDELTPPWEKRGENRPKSWKEHAEYAADLAEWKRNKQEEQIAKVQEEQEKEAKESNKRWNDYWDTELDELVKANKIPAVKDEKDPNDPGRIARVKLFKKMNELGLKRQAEGLQPITSVKLVFYEHYEDEEPAGADAPVSFGKKGTISTQNPEDYSYHDIHGKTVDQIKGS